MYFTSSALLAAAQCARALSRPSPATIIYMQYMVYSFVLRWPTGSGSPQTLRVIAAAIIAFYASMEALCSNPLSEDFGDDDGLFFSFFFFPPPVPVCILAEW